MFKRALVCMLAIVFMVSVGSLAIAADKKKVKAKKIKAVHIPNSDIDLAGGVSERPISQKS